MKQSAFTAVGPRLDAKGRDGSTLGYPVAHVLGVNHRVEAAARERARSHLTRPSIRRHVINPLVVDLRRDGLTLWIIRYVRGPIRRVSRPPAIVRDHVAISPTSQREQTCARENRRASSDDVRHHPFLEQNACRDERGTPRRIPRRNSENRDFGSGPRNGASHRSLSQSVPKGVVSVFGHHPRVPDVRRVLLFTARCLRASHRSRSCPARRTSRRAGLVRGQSGLYAHA